MPDPANPSPETSSETQPTQQESGRSSIGAQLHALAEKRHNPEYIAESFRSGEYPYKTKISRKTYEKHKRELQIELLKAQKWIKESGQKVVMLFEGRDAAGKGGTIKRFMEHLNPRGARVVALEKPSEEERGQWYFQRYIKHLPTGGEVVLFDRCFPHAVQDLLRFLLLYHIWI